LNFISISIFKVNEITNSLQKQLLETTLLFVAVQALKAAECLRELCSFHRAFSSTFARSFSLSSRLPCALFRAAAYHLSAVMLKYMRHVQPVNSATAAVAADAKLHRGSGRGSNNNSGQQRVQQCSRRRCRRSFGAVSWVLGSRRSVSSCWLSRSCARTEKNGTPQLHFQLQFLNIFLESPDF